jgi:nicotinate-nucleotide adenylyltransferase
MKRGFLGGTFNPPHLGHIRAARAAAEQLGLEKLYWIPTGEPPHKTLPEDTATASQRLEMARLAAEDLPCAEALDLEIRRSGRSYTVDTARQLLAEDPAGELWLLCGTDMFLSLDRWYRADWLLEHLCIAAYPRAPEDVPALEEKASALREEYGARVELIRLEPTVISSTLLREALKRGEGGGWLTDALYAYVLRRRLYGVRPDPEALWRLVRPWYKEKRVKHVLGCRDTAVRLARRWGADVLDAENAALLHDVTKRMSPEEQLRLCAEYGIIPGIGAAEDLTGEDRQSILNSEFARRYPQVLHAFSGGAAAWGLFGASREIRDAILWHTTGRPGMGLLEKIIWLADCIEPTRDHPGLEEVRRLAEEDLNAAMAAAMRQTLEHVRRSGWTEIPLTRQTLAYFEEEEQRK